MRNNNFYYWNNATNFFSLYKSCLVYIRWYVINDFVYLDCTEDGGGKLNMAYNKTAEISLGLGLISMILSLLIWIVVEFSGTQHSLLESVPIIAGLPFALYGVLFGGADKKHDVKQDK